MTIKEKRTTMLSENMNNKDKSNATGNHRRMLLKGLSSGAAVSAVTAGLPAKWVTPVIDAVMLPAHAMTTTTSCISLLEQLSADIPQACSGGFYPEITVPVQVVTASTSLEITDLTTTLPGQATMSGVSTGDVFNQGDVFNIEIINYPSASQFACSATEQGNIEIEYNCVDFNGVARILSIDVLQAILVG